MVSLKQISLVIFSAVLAGTALFHAPIAAAGPILVDGPWYEFGFDPDHFPAVSGCLPEDPGGVPCRPPDPAVSASPLDAPPWTFSSPLPVLLSVTDAYLAGDSYDVYDFGSLIGVTPAVPPSFSSCGIDPELCFADPLMSHSSFFLMAGSHSLSIKAKAAQILGEGFLKLTAVPEPTTFLMLGSGAASFLVCARKKRREMAPAP